MSVYHLFINTTDKLKIKSRCHGISTGAWDMDFVSSSPLFSTPPPLFSKFSYKSFFFQNFHNHSFFLHLTISVDVIHHEYYVYSVSTVLRLIQYIREKVSHSIFIFRAISLTSVGKPPCFFTLFTLSTYGTVVSNCF